MNKGVIRKEVLKWLNAGFNYAYQKALGWVQFLWSLRRMDSL